MLRNRYRRILWFFARIILSLAWWDILLPRIGFKAQSVATRPARLKSIAVSFRQMAIQNGGVMIKVGQFLSARLDVLPREITDELSGLQDEVLAEKFEDIRKVVEAEFNQPLEWIFDSFQPTPLASASIGQVHLACLPDKENTGNLPRQVVVKVQRPNIERIVETDLAALRVVGRWLDKYPPIRKHANVPLLLNEFSRSLYEEIDYLAEGKNAETFQSNFAERPDVRVPVVCWPYTTRRVLTLEYIQAIKISDYAAIEKAGLSRSEVASRLFDTYLKQIFEDQFFHADPHPGNLFVFPLPSTGEGVPAQWKLIFIDFGMVGHIPSNMLAGLREILISIGTQDASRLIHAYQMLDVLLPGADIQLLERAGTRLFQRFWGKTAPEMMKMSHAEADDFIQEFGDLIYEMPFQAPENMILLGRCVAILSGICSGLDPDFNLWASITPYAEKLITSEAGGTAKVFLKELGNTVRVIGSLPQRADRLLGLIEQGKLEARNPELNQRLVRLNHSLRQLTGALLFSSFFLGGVFLWTAQFSALALGAWVLGFFLFLFFYFR